MIFLLRSLPLPFALVFLIQCGCAHRDISFAGTFSVLYNRADEFKIYLHSEEDGVSLPCIVSLPVCVLGEQEGKGEMLLDVFRAQHADRIEIRPRRRDVGFLKYCDNPLGVRVVDYDGNAPVVVFFGIPKYREAVLAVRFSPKEVEALDLDNPERMGFPIAMITIPGKECTEYCAYLALGRDSTEDGRWVSCSPDPDIVDSGVFAIYIGNQSARAFSAGYEFEVAMVMEAELRSGEEGFRVLGVSMVGSASSSHVRLGTLLRNESEE